MPLDNEILLNGALFFVVTAFNVAAVATMLLAWDQARQTRRVTQGVVTRPSVDENATVDAEENLAVEEKATITWKNIGDSGTTHVPSLVVVPVSENNAEVEEPEVVIAQVAYDRMCIHLKNDTSQEQGGLLVGTVSRSNRGGPRKERWLCQISDALPCRGIGTPVQFQFTVEAWSSIQLELGECRARGIDVLGWYHSHPRLGVFLSGTDRRTQRSFFPQPWSIAIVQDPCTNDTRAFYGPEGREVHYTIE